MPAGADGPVFPSFTADCQLRLKLCSDQRLTDVHDSGEEAMGVLRLG